MANNINKLSMDLLGNDVEFENFVRDSIITSYIKVYGESKWNNLTNKQKDEVLHITLNDFAKMVL